MIEKLTIENFYSIRSAQTLDFRPSSTDKDSLEDYCVEVKPNVYLLKMAMIYGSNASGKTTILNALNFLSEFVTYSPENKVELIDYKPFLLDTESRNKHTKFECSFYFNQEKFAYQIEFDQRRIYKESLSCFISAKPSNLYQRYYDDKSDSSVISFGDKLGLSKEDQLVISGNTINNSTVLAAFSKSNVKASRLNVVYHYFKFSIKKLLRPTTSLISYIRQELKNDEDGSLNRFLVNFLKRSDFNIDSFKLQRKIKSIPDDLKEKIASLPQKIQEEFLIDENVIFKHKTANGMFDLTEEDESRGTLRLMGLATLLKSLLLEDRIIMIDEVESSLHYDLLSYFIKAYLNSGEKFSQLMLTTHNLKLLDEDFIRRDSVWFTDKTEEGETQLVRLSSLSLHKNVSVYNAYKQNKLVKTPFLGSIYIDFDE